jgi:hypothetical protein
MVELKNVAGLDLAEFKKESEYNILLHVSR